MVKVQADAAKKAEERNAKRAAEKKAKEDAKALRWFLLSAKFFGAFLGISAQLSPPVMYLSFVAMI